MPNSRLPWVVFLCESANLSVYHTSIDSSFVKERFLVQLTVQNVHNLHVNLPCGSVFKLKREVHIMLVNLKLSWYVKMYAECVNYWGGPTIIMYNSRPQKAKLYIYIFIHYYTKFQNF